MWFNHPENGKHYRTDIHVKSLYPENKNDDKLWENIKKKFDNKNLDGVSGLSVFFVDGKRGAPGPRPRPLLKHISIYLKRGVLPHSTIKQLNILSSDIRNPTKETSIDQPAQPLSPPRLPKKTIRAPKKKRSSNRATKVGNPTAKRREEAKELNHKYRKDTVGKARGPVTDSNEAAGQSKISDFYKMDTDRNEVVHNIFTKFDKMLTDRNTETDPVEEVQEKFTALQEKFTALEEKFTALEEKFTALEEENTALEEKFTALEEENTALEEENAALQGKIVEIVRVVS